MGATYILFLLLILAFFLGVIIIDGSLWLWGRGLKDRDQGQHECCTQCFTFHKLMLSMEGEGGREGEREGGIESYWNWKQHCNIHAMQYM